MIKDRICAMSSITWICHLYPVAAGTLPAAQGVMYKKSKLLVLLKIMLI